MGKKKKNIIRVVLDTNILVSALLFEGRLTQIVPLWKNGTITPLLSKAIYDEIVKVLCYPKFSLTESEITALIKDEILPYFEVVVINESSLKICRDPDDDKFIQCAFFGNAKFIITGDKDLLSLCQWKSIRILSWEKFAKEVKNLDI